MIERRQVIQYRVKECIVYLKTNSGITLTGRIQNIWADSFDIIDKKGKLCSVSFEDVKFIKEDEKGGE